ncbi:ATP-binding cassette domain-containing protein [Streptomyces sp. 3MP-14]|uniref:ATP-binding cassette domain-containing protein n=1 Tax=Streptomyces mimosae TaxID=2586635 RepID=A0A5N6AT07_9ACTN|nr:MULTISPECIES: ABC transporter ATP-binding protein [Streptomyces]KAB8170818.1 ATP-binding cassette domain-containing protein [Streptomyces mimosae]KAB8179829.1 ATP-binding cassette domain-containing protein [Streptomyces sp. 3MP-14]
MIRFSSVSVRYAEDAPPVLAGVDLTVPEGELCLLVGPSGAGKSTLLNAVSGLVPHFTGGVLGGTVTVAGRSTADHPPRELADVVGTVGQDPLAHFVTETVEDELAYGMESLGVPPDVMRRRVEETLDLLGLAELRDRRLDSLSGGQRQRVAIGSVLTPHPRVLVLDEPTSALDPAAAEEVLAVLQRLVHDLGTTVLLAEHRLERVVQYADSVLLLPGPGRAPVLGPPAEVLERSPVRPPVVRLAEVAGWSPVPLSVRDARRRAPALRERLASRRPPTTTRPQHAPPGGVPLVETRALAVRRGGVEVLRGVDLAVAAGEAVALMGRNGAGKSTLLGALMGLHAPQRGSVRLAPAPGDDGRHVTPHRTAPRALLRHAGLVPQDPRDLLFAETVAEECASADADAAPEAGGAPGRCRALVRRLLPEVPDDAHPRDLSEGQRLALALAVVLAAAPPLLLLDEPTRGLDYAAKDRLVAILTELLDAGHGLLLATHDVELAAELADRVVVLAEGEVVADGPTARVVTGSPAFAPQVAKVLAPEPWLTVGQVAAALAERAPAGAESDGRPRP